MNNLKNVTSLVKSILENDSQARNSDSFLYLRVLEHYGNRNGICIHDMSVIRFMLSMKEYGFPPFESVRRARQKVQAKYPELAACRDVVEERRESEREYRKYAVLEDV